MTSKPALSPRRALTLLAFATLSAAAPNLRAGATGVSGAAYDWGQNTYGALGNGTTTNSTSPVPVSNFSSGVISLGSGQYFSIGLKDGAVYGWGLNQFGQLGNGTSTGAATTTPTAAIVLTSGVTAVAAGQSHSLAIQNGAAYSWGYNNSGQLGNGAAVSTNANPTPTMVIGLTSGVTAVAGGNVFSLAIQNGAAYAWGSNQQGQLGNGGTTGSGALSSTPVAVSGLSNGVTGIAAGSVHGLAIQNGAAYAWGSNQQGQLGNGGTTGVNALSTTPVAVMSLSTGVTSIAAGNSFSLAARNGNVFAWGNNQYGQLGNGASGSGVISATPIQVDPTDLTNIIAVAAATTSSYALSGDGSLWVWGRNDQGQLGLGTTTAMFTTPQHLVAPAGFYYSAIEADGNGSLALAILSAGSPVVPEPSTYALALLGGAGMLGVVVRQRRAARLRV